ncbi:hypothetical protein COOONC_17202, partial [Cooperia oncophora]
MLVMLGLLLLCHLALVNPYCIQCASPTLLNQWQLTGLPSRPASLSFTPLCDTITSDDTTPAEMQVHSCSTACFEMVIPNANQYHFVRGCHEEFIEAGVTAQQVASDDKCFYSKKGDQQITSSDGLITVPAIAVIHFAKVGDDTAVVNGRIAMKTLVLPAAATADPPVLKSLLCSEARAVNCVKSMYYDGAGQDNNKESCTGGYCTSVEGYLNGRKYIERGCAPISPFTQDTCVTMRTNSTFAAGPGEGGALSREKRSLNVILDATECFCTCECPFLRFLLFSELTFPRLEW